MEDRPGLRWSPFDCRMYGVRLLTVPSLVSGPLMVQSMIGIESIMSGLYDAPRDSCRMTTSIETSEEHGVRYLHFGSRWIQGAMRVARPWALELEYTRDMMMALLLRPAPQWPRKVLLIGLGA